MVKRIVRTWICWIHSEHLDFCRSYVEAGQLVKMRAAPGNLQAITHYRDLGDGTTEVAFISLWESMDHVRMFAGNDVNKPTGQGRPSEDHMTIDREVVVRHREVEVGEAVSLLDWY